LPGAGALLRFKRLDVLDHWAATGTTLGSRISCSISLLHHLRRGGDAVALPRFAHFLFHLGDAIGLGDGVPAAPQTHRLPVPCFRLPCFRLFSKPALAGFRQAPQM
jgi:hypothetical protein